MATSGDGAGGPGAAEGDPADERILLECARKSFVRLAKALNVEIERLLEAGAEDGEKARQKAMTDMIRETQKALLIVLDFERRMMDRRDAGEVDGALDLEAARAEISGRLDRLAERG